MKSADSRIANIESIDFDNAQNFFKLLKSQGVTASHRAPLTCALLNKLLNIHANGTGIRA